MIRSIKGMAVVFWLTASAVVGPLALAGTSLELPLRMPLSALRSRTPEGQGARLICSNDTNQITVNGMIFPASALGSGVLDDVVCRWFSQGALPSETTTPLFGVEMKQTLSFVPEADGGEPLLYDVVAIGSPDDFEAARIAMEAGFGPGSPSSSSAAPGPHLEWNSDRFAAALWKQDRDSGQLLLQYTDRALESRALDLK